MDGKVLKQFMTERRVVKDGEHVDKVICVTMPEMVRHVKENEKAAAKQKRQESTEDAAAPKPPKKARHESPTAAQKPAASSAAPAAPAAAAASPVKLRPGQSMSALTLDQQELLDEFELWQMHGQANPPQEKTCKGYFKAVKNFVEHEYSDFDVARKWDVCNLKRYEELRMTVRASAKDKKGHGHCTAMLGDTVIGTLKP